VRPACLLADAARCCSTCSLLTRSCQLRTGRRCLRYEMSGSSRRAYPLAGAGWPCRQSSLIDAAPGTSLRDQPRISVEVRTSAHITLVLDVKLAQSRAAASRQPVNVAGGLRAQHLRACHAFGRALNRGAIHVARSHALRAGSNQSAAGALQPDTSMSQSDHAAQDRSDVACLCSQHSRSLHAGSHSLVQRTAMLNLDRGQGDAGWRALQPTVRRVPGDQARPPCWGTSATRRLQPKMSRGLWGLSPPGDWAVVRGKNTHAASAAAGQPQQLVAPLGVHLLRLVLPPGAAALRTWLP
jgi:hypothetical protein